MVAKRQRHLVVVSHFLTTSRRYKTLYGFLEKSTVPMVELLCGTKYASVTAASGGTLAAFVTAVGDALARPGALAVDVVLACHGKRGAIKFQDGTADAAKIEAAFAGVAGRERLRLAYDLCCFGASHAAALQRVGFDAVIGSRGVNTNAAFELPTVLGAWSNGRPLGAAVEAGNDSSNRQLADGFAALLFPGADSFKELSGTSSSSMTIATAPVP